jgi:toxin YoeB
MNKVWHDSAWDEYIQWQSEDRKTLKRINMLLKDIDRNPFTGIGKPEPLKANKHGYWSRRIDEVSRIVYRVEDNKIIIIQCGGHYDD